jgi:hypothetical protein
MHRNQKRAIQRDEARKRIVEVLAKGMDDYFALESMGVLQETMAHFYFKAKVLKTLGADAPFEEIDDLMEKAAKWAEKIAAFKHAKIQAMRLASDPNAPVLPESMTLEELRESIMADIERLSQAGVISLPQPRASGVVPATNGNGGESEGPEEEGDAET